MLCPSVNRPLRLEEWMALCFKIKLGFISYGRVFSLLTFKIRIRSKQILGAVYILFVREIFAGLEIRNRMSLGQEDVDSNKQSVLPSNFLLKYFLAVFIPHWRDFLAYCKCKEIQFGKRVQYEPNKGSISYPPCPKKNG